MYDVVRDLKLQLRSNTATILILVVEFHKLFTN